MSTADREPTIRDLCRKLDQMNAKADRLLEKIVVRLAASRSRPTSGDGPEDEASPGAMGGLTGPDPVLTPSPRSC